MRAGESCAEVESTKSVSEVFSPVTGAITEVTGLPKEAVWVVIEEVNPHDWYAAGKPGEPLKK